ncbi:MAG: hypothetical protein NTU43_00325 [Bacteroidetes bacterium]|nr:hypothetical protein [Bacteroidota bacterium]
MIRNSLTKYHPLFSYVNNNIKYGALIVLLILQVSVGVAQNNISIKNTTYTCYNTAMGKGKGIIFRFQILRQNTRLNNKITIDSFYVNSIAIPFLTRRDGYSFSIEANYLKNISEPIIDTKTPSTFQDDIISKHKFKPSWVLLTINDHREKILIKKFKEIKID